ncbi:MAG: exosortase/archaeosortase family protein [Phycisphaerales bacterium]|nr:exosortase/archaeosortase family protein [Phycisphaerales bacterium]
MTTAPANTSTAAASVPSNGAGGTAGRQAGGGRPSPAGGAKIGGPRPGLIARVTEPGVLIAVALLGAAFVLLFRHWMRIQNEYSMGSGDWSHAYMVPFISLYLLWQNREALERVQTQVYWPGLVAILTGVWSYTYFICGFPNHLGQGLSMVLTLFGVVLLLLGPRVVMYSFLPIAYLGFAITIPERVMNEVTWPLQALAAKGAWIGLNTVGVKTDVVGNALYVFDTKTQETHPLNVAEACSGMRMLIAFLALGAAVSLVATRMWWKRVVLLGLAPPLALLLNIVRIMVLGIASLYDQNLSAGQAHTFIGTLLLIPGFFMYMGIVLALNKAVPEAARSAPGPAAGQSGRGGVAGVGA